MKDLRITHIGGPTALIEVGGWRLLTDPTFDAPGEKYNFGWGTSSVKLAGPAIAAADVLPGNTVLDALFRQQLTDLAATRILAEHTGAPTTFEPIMGGLASKAR